MKDLNNMDGVGGNGEPGISERDAEVINTIREEGLSAFSFDGLRRITGAHPETLSRTLERLEEDGYVVRSPEGYSTTDAARRGTAMRPALSGAKSVPILHTFLPKGASGIAIAAALRGKWFDTMRWVGMSEAEDGVVMKWVAEDGTTLIDAKFSTSQLDVEARVKDEKDLGKAVRAAHQLLARISKLYAGPRTGGRTALMQIGYFRPYAM